MKLFKRCGEKLQRTLILEVDTHNFNPSGKSIASSEIPLIEKFSIFHSYLVVEIFDKLKIFEFSVPTMTILNSYENFLIFLEKFALKQKIDANLTMITDKIQKKSKI